MHGESLSEAYDALIFSDLPQILSTDEEDHLRHVAWSVSGVLQAGTGDIALSIDVMVGETPKYVWVDVS